MNCISKGELILRKENKRFGWNEVRVNKGDEFKVVDTQKLTNEKIYNIEFNGEKFSLNWLDAEILIQGDIVDLNKCININ